MIALKSLGLTVVLATSVALIGSASSAATIVSTTFTKGNTQGQNPDTVGQTNANDFWITGEANDCSGFFGNAPTCDVGGFLDPAEEISPLIAKFNFNANGPILSGDEGPEINPEFSTITGNEFSFGGTTGSNSSGTATYTLGNGDPVWRYLVAKSSTTSRMFWVVDELTNCSAGDASTNYTEDCLLDATPLTSFDWSTATGQGISHISFYDSGATPIPVPAAGLLLITALGGLGFAARRRRKAA